MGSSLNRNLRTELDFHTSPLVQRHVKEPPQAGDPLELIRLRAGARMGGLARMEQSGRGDMSHSMGRAGRQSPALISKLCLSQGEEQLLPYTCKLCLAIRKEEEEIFR